MEHPHLFLKLRLVIFSLTTFICLLWVILLSCLLFIRWDASSLSERSFLMLFLGLDVLTMILLPVLLLVKFRTWLDGARLLLLLVCHIGVATSFAIWAPTISCPNDTPDDRGVCQLLNVYIIMASWVPPSFLIFYGVCLSFYTWRYASQPRGHSSVDEETGGIQSSSWSVPVTESRETPSIGHLPHAEDLLSPMPSTVERNSRRVSVRKSRLEKRLP
ncbi:hypothetical protein B0F90DRAFT_1691731, partial [Multifurca ochricompacta]